MKEKVQERINRVRHLATSPAKGYVVKDVNSFRINDSLSKSIRNPEEADIFLAELDAAVKIAKTK
jgi:hypothetical protein